MGEEKFKCDNCEYYHKSKGMITRHWNKEHRRPHGQKRGTRKSSQNVGRPTVITPAVVGKLVAALQNGFTKKQAAEYAEISRDALYDAIKRDEEFKNKIHRAQEHLNYKSREVIAKAITEGDTSSAKWWLERKSKTEFSLRQEVTGKNGNAIKSETVVDISDDELNNEIFGKS